MPKFIDTICNTAFRYIFGNYCTSSYNRVFPNYYWS